MHPGALVVFEGAEGAGKTTQIARVGEWLGAAGVACRTVREPGGTALGERIREILLDPARSITARAETLLFLASRAELVAEVIRPELEGGVVVLADRFFLSTYAYQIGGRGVPEDEVIAANRVATGGLTPDLTLLLRHPVRDGLARADRRGGRDRFEREGDAFHMRIAAAFERFATDEWQRAHPECGPILTVDAVGSQNEVFARIRGALGERIPAVFALPAPAVR